MRLSLICNFRRLFGSNLEWIWHVMDAMLKTSSSPWTFAYVRHVNWLCRLLILYIYCFARYVAKLLKRVLLWLNADSKANVPHLISLLSSYYFLPKLSTWVCTIINNDCLMYQTFTQNLFLRTRSSEPKEIINSIHFYYHPGFTI